MVNNLNDRINCETGELNPPIGMAEAGHEDSEEAATGGTAFTKEFGRGFKAGRESAQKIERAEPSRGAPDAQWNAEDYRRSADVHESAERIIRRVVSNVLGIAYTRTGLHDVADCDPIDEKEFVADALGVALGEDTGCLDPDDLSSENCEVLYVEQELREFQKRSLAGHVVLLEALRHMKANFYDDFGDQCTECGEKVGTEASCDSCRVYAEAEAAIKQAERT